MRLEGKVALITGAATGVKDELMGFGGAAAWRFVAEGAKVVLTDINDESGELAAAQVREQGHEAAYLHLDVTQERDWENAISYTVETFGGLDILVNNAGTSARLTVEETSVEI